MYFLVNCNARFSFYNFYLSNSWWSITSSNELLCCTFQSVVLFDVIIVKDVRRLLEEVMYSNSCNNCKQGWKGHYLLLPRRDLTLYHFHYGITSLLLLTYGSCIFLSLLRYVALFIRLQYLTLFESRWYRSLVIQLLFILLCCVWISCVVEEYEVLLEI